MIRATRQRSVILNELRKTRKHPTADELYRQIRRRLPHVSLATVYRNLELLAASGEILKLEVAGTRRRYDGTTKDHCHVRCTECGRVDDCFVDPLTGMEKRADGVSDYKITGYRLEYRGICPKCLAKEKA